MSLLLIPVFWTVFYQVCRQQNLKNVHENSVMKIKKKCSEGQNLQTYLKPTNPNFVTPRMRDFLKYITESL